MVCCCSLAGTSACKYCRNNPNAEISPYTTIVKTNYTYSDIQIPEIKKYEKVKLTAFKCPICNSYLNEDDNFCHVCGICFNDGKEDIGEN